MPNSKVIDLSHWNTIPQSLIPASQHGVLGCIHKMTEGMGGVDDKCDGRYALSMDAGLHWGVYHFLRPGDMEAQAEWFINSAYNMGVFDDKTLLAADHEDAGVSLDDLYKFLIAVEQIAGRSPVIYSGHVLKDQLKGKAQDRFKRFRLWLAQYTSGTPTLPPGWSKYWIWQWTDKGSVPGINPPTDCNDYQGTAEALSMEWAGTNGGGIEPPVPAKPKVVVTVYGDVDVEVIRA